MDQAMCDCIAVSKLLLLYLWEGRLTSAYHVVDQWLLALEQIVVDEGFPVVAIFDQLVLEEIYEGALIPGLGQWILCQPLRTRRILPLP